MILLQIDHLMLREWCNMRYFSQLSRILVVNLWKTNPKIKMAEKTGEFGVVPYRYKHENLGVKKKEKYVNICIESSWKQFKQTE